MTEAPVQPSPGTPCWVSLMARDLGASKTFYGELLGWEFRPGPQRLGPYVRARLGELDVAGLGEISPDRRLPVTWLPYFATDDADVTCALIRECGGTVGVGPMDSEWGGRVAIAADPVGAAFGIWQTDGRPGVSPDGTPGTFVWNELLVRECVQVTTFYSAVFGYRIEPLGTPERELRTLLLNGRPVGSVRGTDLPEDGGASWVTYFAVPDVEAALRLLRKLGGTVVREVRDSAYGRFARVKDPEGGPFSLIEMRDPNDAVERPLREV
ncbi:VOC family protein [Streptomyces sp. P38-E01]|uniref:VOC family protein n=1 Tax=Streptomyces tardus TaxID=2780544 RepID=A0A949N7P4_9ACTN|nr:VOC family protein [Streptomyces tardus]MBU7600337.1 VOC family protein [Streptomyces tardus]